MDGLARREIDSMSFERSHFRALITTQRPLSHIAIAILCRDVDQGALLCRRTWMMLAEEFLSSGPIHCSSSTPSLYSPRSRPRRTSIEYVGGLQDGPTTAGQPPSRFRVLFKGASPISLIRAIKHIRIFRLTVLTDTVRIRRTDE